MYLHAQGFSRPLLFASRVLRVNVNEKERDFFYIKNNNEASGYATVPYVQNVTEKFKRVLLKYYVTITVDNAAKT